MKILVTGGAGFIASHIVDRYITEGHEVVIIDNLSTGKRANLNSKARFYELDLLSFAEVEKVFKKEKFDLVNHHAAQIDVRRSMAEPVFDAQTNIIASINILECCRKTGVNKIIFVSSGGTIYGEAQYLPVDEKHILNPEACYAAAKVAVEYYLAVYKNSYGLDFTVLRCGNVFGPRQDPMGEAGVVAIFIGKMLKGEAPHIFGAGEQLRDYVYIEDAVEANCLALTKGSGQAVNIGTARGGSVNVIYQELAKIIGFKTPPIYDPPRVGELNKIYLSNAKVKEILGWAPKYTLEAGLRKTVEYFKHHA
jgi:UDP-glucose 4-epimerase